MEVLSSGLLPTKLQLALNLYIKKKDTPWPESASELCRPSDRRLSAKLVPTFADRGVPRGQHDGSLQPYSRQVENKIILFCFMFFIFMHYISSL
jgi:hypothetical protein